MKKKTFTLDKLVQARYEKNIANLNNLNILYETIQHWFPNFFWWYTICGSRAATNQISFDHKFGKPDLTQCGMNKIAVIQARTILTGFQTKLSLFKIVTQLF